MSASEFSSTTCAKLPFTVAAQASGHVVCASAAFASADARSSWLTSGSSRHFDKAIQASIAAAATSVQPCGSAHASLP